MCTYTIPLEVIPLCFLLLWIHMIANAATMTKNAATETTTGTTMWVCLLLFLHETNGQSSGLPSTLELTTKVRIGIMTTCQWSSIRHSTANNNLVFLSVHWFSISVIEKKKKNFAVLCSLNLWNVLPVDRIQYEFNMHQDKWYQGSWNLDLNNNEPLCDFS